MTFPLSPAHLRRYRDVVALLVKYGHGDLVKDSPIVDDPLPFASAPATPPKAAELAADLERLGPTFVKLGQLVSTRADLVPAAYLEALARLQDNVQPFSFNEVEAIVSVEIGARISKAFQEFDPTPLAAASLGQVHRAVLRSGQPVVVKVQRPGVREVVAADLDALAEIAEALDAHTEAGRRYGFGRIVEELRKSLLRELDYRQEAANLRLMRDKLADFALLMIPAPIDDYTTGRVLTMEEVLGPENYEAESAGPARPGRPRARRRTLSRLPSPNPDPRGFSRGPSSGECLPHRRSQARAPRSRYGRPHRAHDAGPPAQVAPRHRQWAERPRRGNRGGDR